MDQEQQQQQQQQHNTTHRGGGGRYWRSLTWQPLLNGNGAPEKTQLLNGSREYLLQTSDV
ncbi:hypothetical protein PG990_006286 [Apiospora arundinis]|uniref:Uncharacterized protein n=1 Tax=Apiospora arundinis TaxID=335852 RepID=A0ABR2JB99_9PEZI